MKEISTFPLKLPIKKIKTRLKIPAKANFKDYDHLIERFFSLIEPVARFMEVKIQISAETIIINDSYEILSKSLSDHLKNCSKATMMGVTIGKWVEDEIEQYKKKKRTLEPLIIDSVGSECTEEAAQYVSTIIQEDIIKNNHTPTKRFSPGYGDLKLDVQKYFFQQLKLEEIGMSLTPALMMIPKKSITAFIGWKKE